MTDRATRSWHHWRTVDAIRIFHVDLNRHPAHEAQAEIWLDVPERARRDRFRVLHAKRAFILCRAALRELLCESLSCANETLSFSVHAYGKPYAIVNGSAQGVAFNVSHSGAHGLVALGASAPVGVDVEERSLKQDLDGIAKRVFTATEQAALSARGGEVKRLLFYRLWTMKEALMKASGQGFSLGPASFAVLEPALAGQPATLRLPTDEPRSWTVVDLGVDAFAAALAYPAPG
jgi:4'-phosphopantetheinyl transferase